MTDANELANLIQGVIDDLKKATAHSARSRSTAEQAAQALLITIDKLKDSRPWIRREIELLNDAITKLAQLFYTHISDHVREAMAKLEQTKILLQEYYDSTEFLIQELEKRHAILYHSRIERELGEADAAVLEAIDQITAYIEKL